MNPDREEGASPAPSQELPIEAEAAAAAEAAPAADANAAESSPADATDAKEKRPSLSDVIRDVVEPKPAAEESSTTAGDQDKSKAEAEPGKPEEAKGEDDESEVPFHEHPRWKKLLRERDELKPAAEQYQNITQFMELHGLVPEEVGEGFEVMALLKSGDPARLRQALEWFEPRVQALRESLGVILPSDLQERVDSGLLDAETAAELAEQRATNALRDRQEEARNAAAAEVGEVEQARRSAQAAALAVQGWEERIKGTDPDYAKKAEMVQTTASAIVMREGRPQTPDEAVALVQRAYDQVERTFKSLVPKRTPVDTTTPAGSSARTTAAPKTLREAIAAAVATG